MEPIQRVNRLKDVAPEVCSFVFFKMRIIFKYIILKKSLKHEGFFPFGFSGKHLVWSSFF